ncbi:MAG: TolC family protein [Pirellulales bacterium]|nr:TolC family protein [Pirellulales bacterium]
MSRQAPIIGLVATAIFTVLSGCQPQQPFYLKKIDDEYLHYKGVATEIEYPDVESERLGDVDNAQAPFSLLRKDDRERWDLTLEEAVRIALTNNKVMRNISGQVQGPPDFIARNPELAPTIYDPAIAESNPRIGPEAALSAFDAQVSASMTWEKLDQPQNVSPFYTMIYPNVARDDLGTFQAKISKIAATGGQFSLTHNVAYDLSNRPSRSWPSDWNVNLVGEVRQPLLQGAGVQFNRIAGPGATPGNFNGVMLARINTDIALADFEAAVRNLVSDVEIAYWELYFQYRSLDAVIAGRDSALQTWRKIKILFDHGAKGGEAEKEAQAREQYFLFRSTAEKSLNNLYATEAKLRYMLGLAATDGRLIRPADEPTTAKVVFDWHDVLDEGLVRSVELREQKWLVKRRELEMIAAKNFLLPRVDLVGQYRWLGIGNRIDGNSFWDQTSLVAQDTNAYGTLAHGDFQEWQMGVQASMPLGFRREMAGVRNAQLSLARERVRLQEAELELSHQLAYAIRELEANYVLSETNFNRRIAAQRQVDAVAAAYETDTITLDVLLNAQQALAQAESDYFRSLVDYNKSITEVHYRKGSLLEYNGVYLAEGPWPAKAYFDARRRARGRAASTYMDYGFTQPRVISRGPIEQHVGFDGLIEEGLLEPTPAQPEREMIPTPAPDPVPADEIPAEPVPLAPEPEASAASGQWKAVAGRPSPSRTGPQLVPTAGWSAVERIRR